MRDSAHSRLGTRQRLAAEVDDIGDDQQCTGLVEPLKYGGVQGEYGKGESNHKAGNRKAHDHRNGSDVGTAMRPPRRGDCNWHHDRNGEHGSDDCDGRGADGGLHEVVDRHATPGDTALRPGGKARDRDDEADEQDERTAGQRWGLTPAETTAPNNGCRPVVRPAAAALGAFERDHGEGQDQDDGGGRER